ncbi:hypothetical protein HID58_006814, partial [Brassica napus]
MFSHTFLDGLCKDGRALQAMELFEMMMARGCRPNMVTYSTLITGLCKEGKIQEAVELHYRMNLQGYPTRTFTLYLSMRSIGISVEIETLDSLVKCLCKKEEFQKTVQLVIEIVADGCIPNKGTWKVLVGHTLDKTIVGDASSESLLRDLE